MTPLFKTRTKPVHTVTNQLLCNIACQLQHGVRTLDKQSSPIRWCVAIYQNCTKCQSCTLCSKQLCVAQHAVTDTMYNQPVPTSLWTPGDWKLCCKKGSYRSVHQHPLAFLAQSSLLSSLAASPLSSLGPLSSVPLSSPVILSAFRILSILKRTYIVVTQFAKLCHQDACVAQAHLSAVQAIED